MEFDRVIYERFMGGASIADVARAMRRPREEIEIRLRAIMVGIRIGVELTSKRDRSEDGEL